MISLYSGTEMSFDGNGLAVLMPLSASVKQVAGGEYSFTLEHPIDPWGKWRKIEREMIVKLPVPTERIPPANVGYDADVYLVTTDNAALREAPSEPTAITYAAWNQGTAMADGYGPGSRVTFGTKNYKCTYWDTEQDLRKQVIPSASSWWTTVPTKTAGAAVVATLKLNTKLFLVSSYDSTWYVMETTYGLQGYIKKSQVTYSHHVTPAELQPRIITEQLFRIKEVSISRERGTVIATGNHVSNDLNAVLVQNVKLTKVTPAMAIGRIVEGFMQDYRGDIATDMTTTDEGTYTGEIKLKNGMYCLTDPDVGIVHYFNGKFTRDNWDLFILSRAGSILAQPYKIRYGYNTSGIVWKSNSSNIVTQVIPVAKDEQGEPLFLPELVVNSTHINDYPVIYQEALNVKGQVGHDDGTDTDTNWTTETLLAEMRTKAGERFSVDMADIVPVDVTIQLQQLEDTEEYVWIKPLADRLNLYDEVKVTDPDIDFTITLYAKEIEYDCIRKKISGIKLSTRIYDDESTVAGYNIMNGALTENKLAKSASDALVNDAVNQVLSIIE